MTTGEQAPERYPEGLRPSGPVRRNVRPQRLILPMDEGVMVHGIRLPRNNVHQLLGGSTEP